MTLARPTITILLMILMPQWQSNFSPIRVNVFKEGHCCRAGALSSGQHWHLLAGPGISDILQTVEAEMVFGIKSQINKRSHTTLYPERLISLTHSQVSSKYIPSSNQFWDCVLSVQSHSGHASTSPANHHSGYSWNPEISPALGGHSISTQNLKEEENWCLSDPCMYTNNSQQTSGIANRLRVSGMNIGWWKLRLFTWNLTIEPRLQLGTKKSVWECLNGLSVVSWL